MSTTLSAHVLVHYRYTFKVLRAHGLYAAALQQVYRSFVVVKLLYTSPAWWGLPQQHTQRVEALLRRGVRSGLYPSQLTAEELIDSADDKLTFLVLQNGDHVFHELLPERVDISYNLRSRSHDRVIPEKKGHLAEKELYHADAM